MKRRNAKVPTTRSGMLIKALKGPTPAEATDVLLARAREQRSKIVRNLTKEPVREAREIHRYLMDRRRVILDQLGNRRDPRATSIRRNLDAADIDRVTLAIARFEGLDGHGHTIRDHLTTILGSLIRFATTLDRLAPLSEDQLSDFLLAYEDVTELWVLSLVADVNFLDPIEAKLAEPWLKALRRCRGCGAKLLGSGRRAFCAKDCQLKTHKQRVRKAKSRKRFAVKRKVKQRVAPKLGH